MQTLDVSEIKSLLATIKYPGFTRDIVSFGLVKNISIDGFSISLDLVVTTSDPAIPQQLEKAIKEILLKDTDATECRVNITVSNPHEKKPGEEDKRYKPERPETLKDVKYVIAVSSGKGGVGKSTFSVNIACALEKLLAEEGKPAAIGLLDCDIYGPSVPLMIGINTQPLIEDDKIVPIENFGVHTMSMGYLIDEDAPVVWRGPMVNKAIQQFVKDVKWGKLEVLVVDLPPGTGDAQLTLVQTIPLDGAVIVTTPQAAAVNVALRGAKLYEKVDTEILGVVENMSYFKNSNDGHKNYIFGEGGGMKAASALGVPFLGEMILDSRIREGGDAGIPIVISHPESEAAMSFKKVAKMIYEMLTTQKEI